jgi:hypothetical protein
MSLWWHQYSPVTLAPRTSRMSVSSVLSKTFSIETYFETKSFIALQARFRRQFKYRRCYQDKRRIHRWVKKFREHETELYLNAKDRRDTHSGRPRSESHGWILMPSETHQLSEKHQIYYRVTKKNAIHILINKTFNNHAISLIFQVCEED